MKPLILLVDDDELFLEELGQVLRSSGYETVEVYNPHEVVETAQRTQPALILMDLRMPWKNGYEIAFELKEMPGIADIPVIAMSRDPDQKNSIYLELSGMRKCLVKPFNPLDLIWSIEEILNKEQIAFV